MFITNTNNRTLYQKVSKYYVDDCLQKFQLLFMFLLTALIVKNSLISAGIFFIFLKTVMDQV